MGSNVQLADFTQRIKRIYPESYDKCCFYHGDPEKPGHTVNKAMTQKYAVCLFPCKNVFIVWDYEQHKKNKKYGAAQSSLTLGKTWDAVLMSKHTITFPYYKKMGTRADAPYEKVYVVHINDWKWFFAEIDAYMSFNDYDTDEHGNSLMSEIVLHGSLRIDENTRKRYSSQKLQRKAEFRSQVLAAYGNRCAVCRCSVIEILEAAHLHGYEVADTDLSADRADNGICLCANHHLMYDRYLIDIDVEQGEVRIFDDCVKQMPWYDTYIQNGRKLIKAERNS